MSDIQSRKPIPPPVDYENGMKIACRQRDEAETKLATLESKLSAVQARADRLEAVTKERDAWKRLAEARHRHSLHLLARDFDRKNEIDVVAAEAALREMGVKL